MISGGPTVTFVVIRLRSKALLHPRPKWLKKMDGDTPENEPIAHGDRPMRIRVLMVRVRAVALDMSVDRTSMGPGLIGAHTSMKKITTAVQDGVGRAMGMTIRSNRTEDRCIDRGLWGGV